MTAASTGRGEAAQRSGPAAPWRTVWITGASSGIGREIAIRLAARGVMVAASARSHEALAALAGEAPGIVPYPLDVSNLVETRQVAAQIAATHGTIDLAILNAGTWHPMGAADYSAEAAARSMAVNYLGIANALEALLPAMIARGSGHVALVSSVAGYRGLPNAAAYAPSKAAVISLAETLKPELDPKGVTVSLVNPGFVDTPMTRVNQFPMPFIVSASDAADRIIRGLEKRRFEIVFPWQMAAIYKLARILPYGLFFALTRRMVDAGRPPAPKG